jgi:hypothetical protein
MSLSQCGNGLQGESGLGHEQPRRFAADEEGMPPKAAATAGGRGFRDGPMLLKKDRRSTGPHLHYETGIDGEAVDPQRFLSAGSKLADVL